MSEVGDKWVHTFPSGISLKLNVNSATGVQTHLLLVFIGNPFWDEAS